jgi:hypothetical protein
VLPSFSESLCASFCLQRKLSPIAACCHRSNTSNSFHILANHSPQVAAFGNQLDYLGVVILMWGATIPSIYYGFYGQPLLQRLYWTVVSVADKRVMCPETD